MLTELAVGGNPQPVAGYAPTAVGMLVLMSELALIERIRQRAAKLPRGAVRLGIGDDCAILQPKAGEEIVVTTDFSLEGRHFTRDRHPAASVGHRVLARGLSDLAAMGAKPMAAFLSLALPRDLARNQVWVDGFLDGLMALAAEYKVPLAGGDTSEAPGGQVIADVVLMGSVASGTALRRSGAKAGDGIYVTGALGGAAAELAAVLGSGVRHKGTRRQDSPHLYPEPRLAVGEVLRRRGLATACLDVSDGISTDLAHLCTASKVRAEIELSALPVHALATALGPDEALRLALHGGEDYELLFTAKAGTKLPRTIAGVAVTRIGTVVKAKRGRAQVEMIAADSARSALEPGGWEHLR